VPRRCASWRRRASRSSESLTVVRCIGMPAYQASMPPDAGDPRKQRSTLPADPAIEVSMPRHEVIIKTKTPLICREMTTRAS
jgi:hypothetical protein